jgi:Phosphoribosyl transferase domain
MDNSVLVWLGPSLVALAGLTIGLVQYARRNWQQLLIDLQGDSAEAAAAVATRVRAGRFPKGRTMWQKRRRRELFEALCLASVFAKSGRSRSLIYAALGHASETPRYRSEIQKIVNHTSVTVSRSWAYTDLSRARRRLGMLRAALDLDGDVRLRLDRSEFEVPRSQRASRTPHPQLCTHDSTRPLCEHAFSWDALEAVVVQMDSVVVVSPSRQGLSAIIALAYHRAARPVSRTERTERLVPTAVGKQVILAKYGLPGGVSEGAREKATSGLVTQLAAVVQAHPDYAAANYVAGVPGRFSARLAEAVAESTKKPVVVLERVPTAPPGDSPQFRVQDASEVRGRRVIVVDDVYRSGATLQIAGAALLSSGAAEVLGLTATCTVSAAAPPCHHGDAEEQIGTHPTGEQGRAG